MAALEPVTGVREQDADKAESAIREIINGIVTALHMGDLVRATREAAKMREPPSQGSPPWEVVSLDMSDAALSPQADAGQFTSSPKFEPLPGQSHAPQLPGGADADAQELAPENAPDPAISIRVGEVTIASPLSQLAETLHQQSSETLEELRSALQDSERSPDAPIVEIRADDQLKFYRDTDNRFVSPDFDIPETPSVENETVAVQPALEGEVQPETVLPESEAVEVQVASFQQPINTPVTETREYEPALDVEEATPTQVVQLPVSEAEALGGQTLAESSTVNPDVWANQTQIFTAEVDRQGNVQPLPTAAIGQSVDAIADQVALTQEAQETTVEYAEQLEDGRAQAAEIADNQDQFFNEGRETSDAIADTQDTFYDERRAATNAEVIADDDPSRNTEMPESHHNITVMLDQACDICYGKNTGIQTIQGNHYMISRDGDSLSVMAKDGRGILLEKNGDQISSFLTPQDVENLSVGFAILQQQQERQFAQSAVVSMPGTSVPTVSQPAAIAGKPQLELD